MIAELTIENIGGLRGKNKYQLESGKLNIIKASNAGGKTSLVRGIASVLSIPNNGQYDIFFLREAQKLGIKTDERNPRESLVNIHARIAKAELKYGETFESYELEKNGNYLRLPSKGDQRFLFAGLLSGSSKVLRQLDGMDEENEPDDFLWAVTRLSNAKNYDDISEHLKTSREDIAERKTRTEKELERISSLESDKKNLEHELEVIEDKLTELEPKFRKVSPDLIARRKNTGREIEKQTKEIGKKKGELSKSEQEANNMAGNVEKTKAEIKKIEDDLKNIDLEYSKGLVEKKIEEINREISNLKKARTEIEGKLSLFQIAQVELRERKDEVKCPLCGDGTISFNEITENLEELRKKKNGFNANILDLNQEKSKLERSFVELKEKKTNIETSLESRKTTLNNLMNAQKSKERDTNQLHFDIERIEKKIEDLNQKLEKLKQGINPEDEKINNQYSELEKERAQISIRIGEILEKLKQTSIEVQGISVDLKTAIEISEKSMKTMDHCIEYCRTKAEEQRRKASERFNTHIKKLMENLRFEEFRTVKLNNEYKLYVERLNPETGDYVFQQVRSLSTSEKLSVALILQLALKETYIPDTRFFILDEIIEDFDEERGKEILDYLEKKAGETDWFVIVTKLTEEEKPLYIDIRGE